METENDESYLLQKQEWVRYQLKMLDQIEAKLEEMRAIAILARDYYFDSHKTQELNVKIRVLEKEVNELEYKSKICWIDCQ